MTAGKLLNRLGILMGIANFWFFFKTGSLLNLAAGVIVLASSVYAVSREDS